MTLRQPNNINNLITEENQDKKMTRIIKFALVFFAIMTVTACGHKKKPVAPPAVATAPSPGLEDKRIIIAYFAPDAKTSEAANMVSRHLGKGDLFKIEPLTPYPTDSLQLRAAAERKNANQNLPQLARVVSGIDDYDVIFLGFPVWNNTYPIIVSAFLSEMSQGLNAKPVIPFCVTDGNDWGNSIDDLRVALPGSEIQQGFVIPRSEVAGSEAELSKWIERLRTGN